MHFTDLGIFNLQDQKTNLCLNAHQSRITGVAHFNENILLSTSLSGELKVWAVTPDSLQAQLP